MFSLLFAFHDSPRDRFIPKTWDGGFTQGLPAKWWRSALRGLTCPVLTAQMCAPPSLKVKDVLVPVITMNFMPGVGIFQCVSTGMTITGKR